MKGDKQVIDILNGVLTAELTSINQYGENVPEILKVDLALEMHALPRLNKGIETCRELGDNNSRHLLEEILEEEEAHVDWLEAQLALIEQVGVQNYLAQQIREEGS